MKRVVSMVLAVAMLVGMLPTTAWAAGDALSAGCCEHHQTHNDSCGYKAAIEGSNCAHQHTADCYEKKACIHAHGEECSVTCSHVCSTDNGCITMQRECTHLAHDAACGGLDDENPVCNHICEVVVDSEESCYTLLCSHSEPDAHDEACGFVEAMAEKACEYICEECAVEEADAAVVAEVKALIDAIPALDVIQKMSQDDQKTVYEQTQAAYDAYEKLTNDQKLQIPDANSFFEAMFSYFNSLTSEVNTGSAFSGECGENVTWELDAATGTLRISGFGAMDDFSSGNDVPWWFMKDNSAEQNVPWNEHQNSIKKLIIEENVTGIGKYAFGNCTELEEIYFNAAKMEPLPINNCAFFNAGINSDGVVITVGKSVTRIPENLFASYYYYEDGNYLYDCNIVELKFEEGTVCSSIGEGAFKHNQALTNIEIGNAISTVAEDAFYDCASIENLFFNSTVFGYDIPFINVGDANKGFAVTIGSGVTKIPQQLFSNSYISSLIFENNSNCECIGSYSFEYCNLLKTVTLPDTVKRIDLGAFRSCESLSSVTIPKNMELIEQASFEYCDALKSVYYKGSSEQWELISIEEYNDPLLDAEISFADNHTHVFAEWYETKAPTQEAEGEERRNCTGCDHFETRTVDKLPDTHEHSYTSVVTEPTCTEQGFTTYICDCNDSYVDNYIDALGHAYNDGEITTEPGCETEGIKTFTCANDPEHHYTEVVAAVGHSFGVWYETKAPTQEEEGEEQRDCSNCDYFETRTKEKLVPDNATEGICGDNLTWILDNNRLVIAGSGDMYDYIWYDVPWVESISSIIAVEFQGEITSIGNNAFNGGSNITVINLPSTLKRIGDFAFDGCTVITKLDIPINVEYIGKFSFRGLGITEITIPEKVKSIGDQVFDECSALEKVTFNAQNAEVGNQVFPDSYWSTKDITLFVGRNVKKIPDNLFSSNSSCTSNLKEIIFEEGCLCTEIGDEAFSDSIKLESVELPKNLVTIGANAFSYCGLQEIMLPDTVTTIENNAFSNSDKLRKINIPKNVVSIGNNAFGWCYALEEIDFDATNMNDLPSYNDAVFFYTGDQGKGVQVTIGCNVTRIPSNLFDHNSSYPVKLKSVIFAEESNCESIGQSAFEMCEELSEIVIPTSVTDIGNRAFCGCKSLKKIRIPENVTSIGRYAFADCTGLTEIGFYPTEVNDEAYYDGIFYGAGIDGNGVTVTIGANVKRIPKYTFSGDSASYYDFPKIQAVIFEDGSVCEEIGYRAFRYCTALGSIIIPGSVKSIESDAFSGCTSLSSVVIPESVTEMGYSVFTDCPKLISAGSLGSGCNIEYGWSDALPENAFYECASITKLTVPGNVKTIGINALYNCTGLTSAGPIGGGYSYEFGWNDFIPEYAFYNCSGLKSVVIPENIKDLGNYAFYCCTALEKIDFDAIAMNDLSSVNNYVFNKAGTVGNGISMYISKDVTRIPAYLLTPGEDYNSQNNSAKVLSLEFEDGSACETIGEYAFWRCNNLKTIQIPEKITSIENTAFSECPSLETIKFDAIALDDLTYSCFESSGTTGPGINIFIGEKVTRIPAFLFAGFSETYKPSCVKTVSFDANSVCESIGESAFCHSILLTDITLPDSIAVIESNAFDGCTVLKKVSIPEGVMKIDTEVFTECTSLECVNLPNTITEIGQSAFSNCSSLKKLQIPSAVTFINDEAFSGCTSLENVEIPESVASIGNNAFRNCESLTEVLLSEGVTAIGNQVFQNCSSLESVTLPNTLEKMGTNNFAGCTNLISAGPLESECSIEFGWVECIPPQAFYNCKNLQSVIIPKTMTTLGEKAFYNCEGLQRISIPETITTLEKEAFYGCTGLTKINFDAVAINKIQSAVFDNAGTAGDGIDVVFGADVKYVPLGLFASHDDSDTKPYIRTVKFARRSVCEAIDASAFKNCTELLWIEIPKSIYTIGDYAFAGCYHLSDVYYEGSEAEWKTNIEQNGLSQIWHPGNEYLIYNNVHYNSFAPGGDDDSTNNDENESSNSNCYVRYFRKWDADSQTAYWGEEPPIVEGLDLGSQVTAETDTSFIANVDDLVGTYVLAATKVRDDGMIAADILLSITPVDTLVGVVTAISSDDGTITIDGTTCSYTVDWLETAPEVGDTVRYFIYDGEIVDLQIIEDTTDLSILYFSSYDEKSQTVTFGRDVKSMAAVTNATDMSFLNDLDNLLGQYVLAEINEQDGKDQLLGITAVETGVGTVTAVDETSITIDGTIYDDSGWSILRGVSPDDYILYHIYEGKILYTEVLSICYGDLVGWNKEKDEFSVEFYTILNNAERETISYPLSNLADTKTIELLDRLSSGNTTIITKIQIAYDSQGIAYNVREAQYEFIVSSDYSNLSFQKNSIMTLSVGILDDGVYVNDLSDISFQIEDTSIIDVASTFVEGHYRYILLTGLGVGTTTVKLSDSEREITAKLHITVTDSQYHYYTLSTVPTVYVEKYPTNFYNVNGLYIDNYHYEIHEDKSATISFDAYNTNFAYGVVEVYDGDGELYSAALIKRMKSVASSLKTVLWDDIGCLIRDIVDLDLFTYRQESGYSKYSHVSVDIPSNGYVRIIMDPSESAIGALINSADLMISAGKLSKKISSTIDSDTFAENMTQKCLTDKLYIEILKSDKDFAKKLWNNVGKKTFLTSESVGDFVDTLANNLDAFNLGKVISDTALSVGFSMGEKMLTYIAGPARPFLNGIFISGKAEDVLYQCADFGKLQDTGSIVIQNQGGGSRNLNRVRVESTVDFSNDTVLSVFNVSLDMDSLSALKNTDPELYKAISEGSQYTYNISLLRNGKEIQPESEVTVYIPIPTELKALANVGKAKVYRVETNGTLTEMETIIKDEYFVFTTEHFSIYTIIGFASETEAHEHIGGTATCTKKAICSVCGTSYGKLADHDYETIWSQGDANGHWHECKNCSAHDTQVKHTSGAAATEDTAQFCTACGYVITPALGHSCTTGSKWYSNGTYHWHVCTSCGAWVKTSYHSYSSDTDETCNVCGYTRTVTATEPTEKTESVTTGTTEATVPDEKVIATDTVPVIVPTETNEDISDNAVSEDTDSRGVSGVLITVFTIVALGSLAALAILLVYKKRRKSE